MEIITSTSPVWTIFLRTSLSPCPALDVLGGVRHHVLSIPGGGLGLGRVCVDAKSIGSGGQLRLGAHVYATVGLLLSWYWSPALPRSDSVRLARLALPVSRDSIGQGEMATP
jgi:hypothetical protein